MFEYFFLASKIELENLKLWRQNTMFPTCLMGTSEVEIFWKISKDLWRSFKLKDFQDLDTNYKDFLKIYTVSLL